MTDDYAKGFADAIEKAVKALESQRPIGKFSYRIDVRAAVSALRALQPGQQT